ncbi:Protein ERGIC-53 [Nymphon striatum]|nr:Protein ERGIC-53 [Nymphon striatum]
MASPVICLSLCLIIICLVSYGSSNTVHKKYEYKYCFKGPYLAQHDGSVPFWEHGGHAQPSEDRVRITSSLKSQKGSVWCKLPTSFEWWEAEITFRIHQSRKSVEGTIFGSNDRWKGLGIIFDSFDNDGKNNNPFISAVLNDGTKSYDHEKDGTEQQLAGCLRDYRNKPHPTKAKIEYYNNVLTVMFHNGLSKEDDFEMCIRQENVYLPKAGFFGISAATGALADDHDVLKFITHSLSISRQTGSEHVIPDTEKEKFSKEYDQFSSKLEQQKEDYKKQHPDRIKKEQAYETAEERELRQIYDGQNAIFRLTRELNHKCDEIIGRQERTLSLVQAGQVPGNAGQPPAAGGTIGRHEMDTILSSQREAMTLTRDIKSFILEIHQKMGQGGAKPGGGGGAFDGQILLHELRDGMNGIKKDVSMLSAKQPQVANCPTLQGINCITTGYFVLFIVLQGAMFFGYIMYKNSKEAQAKKFY